MEENPPPDTEHAPCEKPCAIEQGASIIEGKWKGSILLILSRGDIRYNDLNRQLKGASKKMLSQRLRELEQHGLVVRTVLSTKPFAVAYGITARGRAALALLSTLSDWID